ncbi:MAG TPA: SDR family oxidoreductase [Terriglobales bacterium]|nr:SDR family oxidoreductase [Terriglobales bacterium]
MSTKIAVITGSSSGIGLLTTVELAKSGFQVIATMRELARREKLEQAASSAGVRPYIDTRRLDVTEFDLIQPFVEKLVRDHGRIDLLVNNAGFAVAGFAEDLTVGEIRSQFETNFFGQVAMTKAVLPTMRQQRSGHIIMVSSISGLHGAFSISSYSASKFALEGWTESLRMELNSLGIKVVLVEPGSYETDIWTRNARIAQKMLDGTSPNRERGQKMRDRVQAIPKRDPIIVARAITRIAQDPNPRLRYVIGPDAHIQLWMKRLLPWKWHEKLVAKLLKVD